MRSHRCHCPTPPPRRPPAAAPRAATALDPRHPDPEQAHRTRCAVTSNQRPYRRSTPHSRRATGIRHPKSGGWPPVAGRPWPGREGRASPSPTAPDVAWPPLHPRLGPHPWRGDRGRGGKAGSRRRQRTEYGLVAWTRPPHPTAPARRPAHRSGGFGSGRWGLRPPPGRAVVGVPVVPSAAVAPDWLSHGRHRRAKRRWRASGRRSVEAVRVRFRRGGVPWCETPWGCGADRMRGRSLCGRSGSRVFGVLLRGRVSGGTGSGSGPIRVGCANEYVEVSGCG